VIKLDPAIVQIVKLDDIDDTGAQPVFNGDLVQISDWHHLIVRLENPFKTSF